MEKIIGSSDIYPPKLPKDPETSITALVTGGGTGIGRAIALRFLREGYRIVIVGRRLQSLEEMARDIDKDHPGQVLALGCDLTRAQDVEKLGERLAKDELFGRTLKVLVNNAGIYERRSFVDSDDELWERIFSTNLLGSVRITRALLPLLSAQRGSIVNISSTLGLRPVEMTSAYSASKAAMNSLTQTLALELAPQGVRVNSVCPGIVDTPIHSFHFSGEKEKLGLGKLQPLGRIGQPEDIAHAVWSLVGPGSEWITGSILTVDGGISLA